MFSERKSEESAGPSYSKKLNMDPNEISIISPSLSQTDKIYISPSIARNPNKYLGAGSHKRNLQEAIESSSTEPRTPTKSPNKKRLSKFSPFKSPNKSPRKEMFPQKIDDKESDSYLNSYDRTFEKVIVVSVVQMKEWLDNNDIEDSLIDLSTLEKFCTLSQSAKTLYVRLVNRKHAWLKKEGLEEKYGKSGADVMADIYTMTDAGVLEANYENEDLLNLLNLLQVHELKKFCKELKLPGGSQMLKSDLVNSVLNFSKTQRTMFGGDCQSKIKQLINKYLGECVKLSADARDAFLSCVILVTFPFYNVLSDHVTRLNDYLSRIVRTVRGEIQFPKYALSRTCVFKSRKSFEEYIKAFELCTTIEIELSAKSCQGVILLQKALQLLKETLKDEKTLSEIVDRPIYLRRYSAGYLFVKILFEKLPALKRDDPKVAEEALLTLVNQNYFKDQSKGIWFEALAQLYQIKFKNNNKAADILLQAFATLEKLRLEKMSEEERSLEEKLQPVKKLKDLGWVKYSLIQRALVLIDRQKGKIDLDKAEALRRCIEDINEPLVTPRTVTLSGKLMPNTMKGMKQIYVIMEEGVGKEQGGSRSYMSVEDQARAYFKRLGYTGSRHDEGATLRYILYALLWDIIYCSPKYSNIYGVFHSPYQEAPLDWRTPNFYERRKTNILKRLSEIKDLTAEQIIAEVMRVVQAHVGESCVINNWALISSENVNLLTNYVSCIGVPLFVKIGEHIIKDVNHNARGFPDLTVWNPAQQKSIFVEVKSQNDRLSVQQKVWLHHLNTWGADCCEARLKPTGGAYSAEVTTEEKQ